MNNPNWKNILQEEFCGCCAECDILCCACFFPCISSCRTQQDIGKGCCCGLFCVFLCGGYLRGRVYETLGVDNNCVGSCLKRCFCHVCALSQEARAVRAYREAANEGLIPKPDFMN